MKELLTVQEAARALKCSERHVRHLIESGRLSAYKPGKRYLIARENVLGFLKKAEYDPWEA